MALVCKYECKYCKKLYDDEHTAEECEASHIMPEKLKSVCFVSNPNSYIKVKTTYPLVISVIMKDGAEKLYDLRNPEKINGPFDSDPLSQVFDNVFKKKENKN